MVYLQQRYPAIYGESLTGPLQDWAATAMVLAGGAYFATDAVVGTEPVRDLPIGLQKFLADRGFETTEVAGMLPQGTPGGLVNALVGELPAGYSEGVPTLEFLESALEQGSPVILSILYEGETAGHNVLLTAINWSGNGTSAIGTVSFIDPLDSANYNGQGLPASMKLTTGNVTILPQMTLQNPETGVVETLQNVIQINYVQYHGRLPYEPANYKSTKALVGGATFLRPPNLNRMVRFTGNAGEFDLELFGLETPLTMRNFLNYVESGRYDGSFIHRSVPGFV
ncbi:MAG: peptidylprolyl isomerase, partial [Spartobacteria bacterium]